MPRNRKQSTSFVKTSKASRQTIGTHIVADSRKAKNTKVSFSNRRTAARSARGTIDHVLPRTSSAESYASYHRRSRNTMGFALQEANRHRRLTIIIVIVVLVLGLFLASLAFRAAFAASVNGKIALKDDAVSELLVAPENANSPYYTLIAGEYSDSRQGYDGPNLLVLLRVDPANSVATMLSIPSNTEVYLSDSSYHPICEAQLIGGDAYLISTVADLCKVDIAHYVKTDEQGFQDIVDKLGGVTVDLPVEVDDPEAGSVYLSAGTQTLDGQQALLVCRADNYADPVATRCSNQMNVLNALVQKIIAKNGFASMTTLDSIKNDFKTDLKAGQMRSLLKDFNLNENSSIYAETIPGSLTIESKTTYYSVSSSSLQAFMDSVNENGLPTTTGLMKVDPSTFSVDILNGAGIDGGAAAVSEQLQAAGFKVGNVGNTDTNVYDETLVICKDKAAEAAAETVVDTLKAGRVVTADANLYYNFDTDLLVIVGADWKPLK